MTILLIILVLSGVLMLAPTLRVNYTFQTKKSIRINACVWMTGTSLLFFSGLRHYSIGVDTKSYVLDFYQKKFMSWGYIIENYKEPLYNGLVKLLSQITDNYTIYLFVVSAIFMGGVIWLLYRYSENYFMSFLCLVTLGYFYFSMAGLRQTAAMTILFFSYRFVRERRLIPFLLMVLLACGFHNSAVVFILIYPLAYMKMGWKQIGIIVGGYLFSGVLYNQIFSLMFSIESLSDRFGGYQEYTSDVSLAGYIIQICILLFCLYYYRTRCGACRQDQTLYNMLILGILFQGLTPYLGEFFRISMYFSVYSILAIPNTCASEPNENTRKIVTCAIAGILLIYFVLFSGPDSSIMPYRAYWQ